MLPPEAPGGGPSCPSQLLGLQASLDLWPRPSRLCLRLHGASPLSLSLPFCLLRHLPSESGPPWSRMGSCQILHLHLQMPCFQIGSHSQVCDRTISWGPHSPHGRFSRQPGICASTSPKAAKLTRPYLLPAGCWSLMTRDAGLRSGDLPSMFLVPFSLLRTTPQGHRCARPAHGCSLTTAWPDGGFVRRERQPTPSRPGPW